MMNQQPTDPRVELAQERTEMAKFRTQIALDRTTLAWIRTTLTMATFGFGAVGFFRSLRQANPNPETIHMHESAIRFGLALIVLGLLPQCWRWFLTGSRCEGFVVMMFPSCQWPLSITIAMLLTIIGLVSLWYVFPR